MSRVLPTVVAILLAAGPAAAQLRSVVVPAETGVVIAPRGAPPPRVHLAPAGAGQRFVMVAPGGETLAGPTALTAAGIAAAAAAAALFAGAGGGGGGSGGTASATASTAVTRR